VAADEAGFDSVWTWDHLMGGVHRAGHVLECWTILTALAAMTQRVALSASPPFDVQRILGAGRMLVAR